MTDPGSTGGPQSLNENTAIGPKSSAWSIPISPPRTSSNMARKVLLAADRAISGVS
jgi:hypothetical protein